MHLSLINRAQIKMELEAKIGLPVDIVAKTRGSVTSSFQNIAIAQSIQLEM